MGEEERELACVWTGEAIGMALVGGGTSLDTRVWEGEGGEDWGERESKSGGFDEKLSNNEDYAFSRKLKSKGLNIKFVKNAIVYWMPRTNLLQAFTMFYRFAKGDTEAKIFRPKVALVFIRYFAAMYLLFTINYLLLTSLFFIYIVWAIYKNYKYVKDYSAFTLLPLIQFTVDVAVISGTTIGVLNRR